jgi:hypothetical protein
MNAVRKSRPEIIYHYWAPQNGQWTTTKKHNQIFFDPPYFTKKKKEEYQGKTNGNTPSISSYPRELYKEFFERFFLPAREK